MVAKMGLITGRMIEKKTFNVPAPSPKAEPFKIWMAQVAKEGGSVAKAARKQLESKTGKSAISASKASVYLLPTEEEKE